MHERCIVTKSAYIETVRQLFVFLHERNGSFLAAVVASLLIEPLQTLRAGYFMLRGLDALSFVNPPFLSPSQLQHDPVLLIHGDSSTAGIFKPLLAHLVKENPAQPLFTIDLKSKGGLVSAKEHLTPLLEKVRQIHALYPAHAAVKIAFIGHSSGGDILGPLCKAMHRESSYPKALIKIGSIFKKEQLQEFGDYLPEVVLEVVGTHDVFEGYTCHVPHKFVVNAGHIGLLFHASVFACVTGLQKEISASSTLLRKIA